MREVGMIRGTGDIGSSGRGSSRLVVRIVLVAHATREVGICGILVAI